MEKSKSVGNIPSVKFIGPHYDAYLVGSVKNIVSHVQQIWNLYPNATKSYRHHLYIALSACTTELVKCHKGILTAVTLTPQQCLCVMKDCDKALSVCFGAGMKLKYHPKDNEDVWFLREIVREMMPVFFTLQASVNESLFLSNKFDRLMEWGFEGLVKEFIIRYQ